MLVDKLTLPVTDLCEAVQKNGVVCRRNNCKIHKAKIIVQKQEQEEVKSFKEKKELLEKEKKKLEEERELFEQEKKKKDVQMCVARAGGNPHLTFPGSFVKF